MRPILSRKTTLVPGLGVLGVVLLAATGLRLSGPAAPIAPPAASQAPRTPQKTALIAKTHTVTLEANGQVSQEVTFARTVAGALRQAGITPGPRTLVTPSPTSAVRPGEVITVSLISQRIVTRNVSLPYAIQTKSDPYLAQGLRQLIRQGQNGTAALTESLVLADDKVISSTVVSEKVIAPAVPEIVAVGPMEPSRGTFTGHYVKEMRVEATAYWANPAWSTGYTFTGVRVHIGSIAVDPRVIPLGTRLYVDGYGYGVADDTGGAIKGAHIDLYFPTRAEVDAWGLRYVNIYILGP